MKSERDQMRAREQQVLADLHEGKVQPPAVVGGLIPGGYNDPDGYIAALDPDANADGAVVIHNDEQLSVMADLARLKDECDAVIKEAAERAPMDENLYRQDVDWQLAGCARCERWIDDEGGLGWRVQISGADSEATRFFSYVEGTLRARGWDSAVAESLR